ncbi:MAG TPA: hypothetical protein VHB21_13205 [Minicystis sp.]|nr:hypothetical protein [Minicystis sp.]
MHLGSRGSASTAPTTDDDAAAERAELLDLVLRASLRQRREVTKVLLATYRVELTQALRTMAHRNSASRAPLQDETLRRAAAADFDRVFALAAEIAAAAGEAKLPAVRSDALALEKSAAAAHLGGPRSESELLAAGLKVIEQILAASPDGARREDRPSAKN